MNATLLSLTAGLILVGILVVTLSFVPAPHNSAARMPGRMQKRIQNLRKSMSRRNQLLLASGFALGVILFAVSGWAITLIAVPVAAVGIPALLSQSDGPARITRLEAIEQWTRSLAGLLGSGSASIERAIALSVQSVPANIAEPVNRLAARIAARWSTPDALQQFAVDLDDPTGDLVVAHLKLAANARGGSLERSLEDLAQDVFDEVKARRQVEADRAKTRQVVRFVTYVTLGLLLLLPLGNQFFSAYQTPIGQLMLTGWLIVYVILLLRIKKRTQTTQAPRILISDTPDDDSRMQSSTASTRRTIATTEGRR